MERPAAEEIIEGVLLSAQREHEEKKLQFLGYLLANIAFDPSIDKSQANLLIKIGKNISFRQMCLLSIFRDHDRFNLKKLGLRSSGFPYPDMKRNSLFQEAFDLGSQGLLYRGCPRSICEVMQCEPVSTASDLVYPDIIGVVGIGFDLWRLMELWRIDEAELKSVISLMYEEGGKNSLIIYN